MDALERFGIEQAEVVSAHEMGKRSEKGHRLIRIAKSNIADSFAPSEIDNSLLSFAWHKQPKGYEIVAYLS